MTPDRHAAFLSGINLGKRRVKMDDLRKHFEALDVENVATFIASGNVVFDLAESDPAGLEREIERHLAESLGFHTDVFVRSLAELDRIARHDVLTSGGEEGFQPHVIFLHEEPDDGARQALEALQSEDDRFPVLDREVVWLRRGRLSDSPIETRHVRRALGDTPNTMRNLNTLERMLAKFGSG